MNPGYKPSRLLLPTQIDGGNVLTLVSCLSVCLPAS